jgi:hypothetical protein
MLDFAPGHAIPSVQVINFGLATHCPPTRGDPIRRGGTDGRIPDWDIPYVLALLRDRLTPLTIPPAQRRELFSRAVARAISASYGPPKRRHIMAAYFRHPPPGDAAADDDDGSIRELRREFDARKAAAMDTDTDTDPDPDPQTPPPVTMSLPSLQPVIVSLRRAAVAALWDVEQGAAHREFREGRVAPRMERGAGAGGRAAAAVSERGWPAGVVGWVARGRGREQTVGCC